MDVNEILYIYSCRPIQLFVDFICNFLSTLSNIKGTIIKKSNSSQTLISNHKQKDESSI